MTDPVEARLVELEIRLAHHERQAEELSSVMAEQGQTLDRLTQQVRRLAERLREIEAAWPRPPQDDRLPPHY